MEETAKNLDIKTTPDTNLLHNMDNSAPSLKKYYLIGLAVIISGVVTGLVLSKAKSSGGSSLAGSLNPLSGGQKVVGSADTSTFKDMAEGQLQKGGIDGEGTHKLIRPGGDSQTVYLTSTVLDLDQFVGKKVRVWGQTYSAKTAGWLMDVGRVQVL